MSSLVFVLLCTLSLSAVSQVNIDKDNVISIVVGIIEGLAEEAHFDINNVDKCIRDSDVIL